MVTKKLKQRLLSRKNLLTIICLIPCGLYLYSNLAIADGVEVDGTKHERYYVGDVGGHGYLHFAPIDPKEPDFYRCARSFESAMHFETKGEIFTIIRDLNLDRTRKRGENVRAFYIYAHCLKETGRRELLLKMYNSDVILKLVKLFEDKSGFIAAYAYKAMALYPREGKKWSFFCSSFERTPKKGGSAAPLILLSKASSKAQYSLRSRCKNIERYLENEIWLQKVDERLKKKQSNQ